MGLTAEDIYKMELWELNLYIKAFVDRDKQLYKRDLMLAYNTGAFASSMHPLVKKKPKSLTYYLDKVDESLVKKTKEEQRDGIEFAKKMAERRKNGRSNIKR